MGLSRVVFALTDTVLRSLILPLTLLAAALLRYNLFSLVYLILFCVGVFIPSPRLKSQRFSSVVYLFIIVGASLIFLLAQAGFQATLATDFSLELCETLEVILRQSGLIQFRAPTIDVIRHLFPDIVVLVVSSVSAGIALKVSFLHSVEATPTNEGTASPDEETALASRPHVIKQEYYQMPTWCLWIIDIFIFLMFLFVGAVAPSLTSFFYYFTFLALCLIWSFHLSNKLRSIVRLLRVIGLFYSCLHLIVLYLYQFQSFQLSVPVEPVSDTDSLIARLLGLTPVILTKCVRPTELLVWTDTPLTYFINPWALIGIFWLLGLDFQLWLSTKKHLWIKDSTYYIPVLPEMGGDSYIATGYGATGSTPVNETSLTVTPPDEDTVSVASSVVLQGIKLLWTSSIGYVKKLATILMDVNYIVSLIAMMAWSVLYPTWLALVLLIWACVIWLIPKLDPKRLFYLTSPLLLLYSVALVLLQYVHSLNLTSTELSFDVAIAGECDTEETFYDLQNCRATVLAIKSVLMLPFCGSVYQFIHEILESRREDAPPPTTPTSQGEEPLIDVVEEGNDEELSTVTILKTQLQITLMTYWILVVVGAFLLVILVGNPSLLKSVYVAFFFVFLLLYQIFGKLWVYFNFPFWCFLVGYAVLHLILVYTFPFPSINSLWISAYNSSNQDWNMTANEFYDAVGLLRYSSSGNGSSSLFNVLIPLAIFIVALVLQLRYFTPFFAGVVEGTDSDTLTHNIGILFNRMASFVTKDSQRMSQIMADLEREEEEGVVEEHDKGVSLPASITVYKIILFMIVNLRLGIVSLWHLMWRFLQLHLHKAIIVSLFGLSLHEVSASYLLLVAMILITTALPIINRVAYPLVTAYLGLLTLGKFLFQLSIFDTFNFKDEDDMECASSPLSNQSLMFNYTYTPTSNDSSWIGLNKAASESGYIAGPLLVALLIALSYSTRRHQKYYYASNSTQMKRWEVGSLFLGVEEERAHQSWIAGIKYLVNHFFEIYGVEVCLIVQSIVIVVRIDVYGVIAALLLGAMLVTPRKFLHIFWVLFLVLQGVLILVQYIALLGAPRSALCDDGYPWDVPSFINQSYHTRLEKWLFIPHTGADILDRSWLFVNLISYVCMAQQMKYFIRNPLRTLRNTLPQYPKMYDTDNFFDYLKIILFQYYFWLAIFFVFVAGAFGLDVFGLIFLLSCFVFLYRGQALLSDSRRLRKRWWVGLQTLIFFIILIRIMLELVGCVFVSEIDLKDRCVFIAFFNLRCSRPSYYGMSSEVECDNGTRSSLTLAIDVLSFILVTVQIILLDTQYSDQVADEINEKETDAVNFKNIMKELLKEQKEENTKKQERDLNDLKERAERLKLTEGKVAHLLNVGTRIPPEYRSVSPTPSTKKVSSTEPTDLLSVGGTPTITQEEKEEEEEEVRPKVKADVKEEVSKWKKFISFLWRVWLEVVDYVILWLEENSSVYTAVLKSVKKARKDREARRVSEEAVSHTESREVEEGGGVEEGGASVGHGVTVVAEVTDTTAAPPVAETRFTRRAKSLSPPPEVKRIRARRGSGSAPNFDKSGDFLLDTLQIEPTKLHKDQAKEVEERLGKLSTEYSERPRRLLRALYYWTLSHFEYVVFLLIILAILRTGSFISFFYGGLLFMWGLLYIPWPNKRYWLTLLFFTMIVLVVKYIYYFIYVIVTDDSVSLGDSSFLGLESPTSWIFGVEIESSFFSNSFVHLLLLMSIIFHRGLLKQNGLWYKPARESKKDANILSSTISSIKVYFKTLFSNQFSGSKDYYQWMLFFDVLCFITIVLGYSHFYVSAGSSDVSQLATFIQSNNVPLPFLIMLFLQFLSMLVDRAIYLRHSIVAKLVFYVLLLVVWHLWLLIILPIVTEKAFIDNPAAQAIYFFKSMYFIVSAIQMISGYPRRLLGYFVGESYSTISGVIFIGYRAIPIIPELREVMDWVFTDTSLTVKNWLRVQEIWSTLYQIKVRREREKSLPRDLGDKQSLVIKLFLGGAFLVALVLLIWGPLLVISLVNQTSSPNPPIYATVDLHLEGYQLLEIQAQSSFIYNVNQDQFNTIRDSIDTSTIRRDFDNLFYKENFKRILFPGSSSLLWTASQPSQDELKHLLVSRPNNTHKLDFTWTFRRSPGTGVASETISGSKSTLISTEVARQFLNNLNGDILPINLTGLYPVFVSAPANEMSTEFKTLSRHINGSTVVDCSAILNRTETDNNITINQWWTLTQASKYKLPTGNEAAGSLEMIVHSEPVVPVVFSYVSNLGIIGLYVSVVLVISKFLRGYINSLALEIIIDEIPYPDRLLELCDDIFAVREAKDFVLEEILVGRLIYIFRSPERLLKITEIPKTKQD